MKGSVRERSKGVWEVRASAGVDVVTGRYRYVSKTVRGTKRDAERELAKLVVGVDNPRAAQGTSSGAVTLTELVAAHLDHHQEWSPTTLLGYRSILDYHIRPTIGRLRINKVDARLLDQFYDYLFRDLGLSASRIHQVHSVVRGAFATALRWGWVSSNPARDARPPTVRRAEIVLPSVDLVREAIEHAAEIDPAFGLFVRLAASTGARRGELSALRWSDVRADATSLRIETSAYDADGGGVGIKETKNHSKRTVSLDGSSTAALREHHVSMTERAAVCETVLRHDGFVFSDDPDGETPWMPDRVTKDWARMCRRAGLSGVRLHDLRHFQATMLLRAGVPVKNVSSRIGHRDASMTLNVYAHFLEEEDLTSAEVIGDLLGPPATKRAQPRRRRPGS